MAGDKGSRGKASRSFEKNDSVIANRKQYGELAYDEKTGKKKVISDSRASRNPADLGLKQWDGK